MDLLLKCEFARELVLEARKDAPPRPSDRITPTQQILDKVEAFPSDFAAPSALKASKELAEDYVFNTSFAAADAGINLIAKRYGVGRPI